MMSIYLYRTFCFQQSELQLVLLQERLTSSESSAQAEQKIAKELVGRLEKQISELQASQASNQQSQKT